jgi:hypothetical protein
MRKPWNKNEADLGLLRVGGYNAPPMPIAQVAAMDEHLPQADPFL